jgi:hypothetical protein
MWRVIDDLLGRVNNTACSTSLTADDFSKFFANKIADIRLSTCCAPDPVYTVAPPQCQLDCFSCVSESDVLDAIKSLPTKQCDSDPMPTWLLKANSSSIARFLTELFNKSLSTGDVPLYLKSAYIIPRLKKPDLDDNDARNYRPISNLPVLAKLLERLVAKQLLAYLRLHGLLPRLQSAYRAAHSTETALLKITSDILSALDKGDLVALTLLDLSAAFDTVDHNILLRRMRVSYGISGVALNWFHSYLVGRKHHVRYGDRCSETTFVDYGVPQGSVLGPILFIMYTADLIALIEHQGLQPHLYADDTQIVGSCRPTSPDTTTLRHRIETCIADIANWMSSNRLQQNTSKSEVMWCSTSRRRHSIPSDLFIVGSDVIVPAESVRNLGLYLDTTMSMRCHITQLTSTCFGVLRQIRSIRRCLTRNARTMLVTCFVFARLDYCNAVFAGLPRCDLDRLQSIQNAAVRLIAGARQFDHVTPLLQAQHWLPIEQRIVFKLCVMMYKSVNGMAPSYLQEYVISPDSSRSSFRLRSADTGQLYVPRTRTALGDRAFAVAGPRTWNSLPVIVRSSPSLSTFKKLLKTYLFRCAYNTD